MDDCLLQRCVRAAYKMASGWSDLGPVHTGEAENTAALLFIDWISRQSQPSADGPRNSFSPYWKADEAGF